MREARQRGREGVLGGRAGRLGGVTAGGEGQLWWAGGWPWEEGTVRSRPRGRRGAEAGKALESRVWFRGKAGAIQPLRGPRGGRWGVGGVWAEHSEQKKFWEVTSWWWEGARKAGKRHPSGSPNTQGLTSAHVHTQACAHTHTRTISPTEVQVQPGMPPWVLFCTPPPIP